MKHLVPCPECSRHVRVSENACPFCDAALDLAHVPEPVVPNRRLSRVALLAFSATLAVGVGACGGDTDSDKGSGGSGGAPGGSGGTTGGTGGATGGDGGFANAATLYGIPPPDDDAAIGPMYGIPPPEDAAAGGFAGSAALYGDPPPPVDAGTFPEGGVPLYGAPPPAPSD